MILMEDKSKEVMLLSELAQMKELTMQLLVCDQLDSQHSPAKFCKSLAARILLSVDRLIYVAATLNNAEQQQLYSFPRIAAENSASTYAYNCNSLSKKRKVLPRRKVQLKFNASSGGASIAATPDDGYCWRKYGNKSILGAKHPRSYYRCKDRITKGCLVTKQVQRSDEDPQVLDVIYHGDHTCRRSHTPPPSPPEKKDYSLLEFGAAAGQSAKTEAAMEAEEAKNDGISFLARPSASASCTTSTTESDCLFDELYDLPAESNSDGDFVLTDRDFWSTGIEEFLAYQAYM